MIKPLTVDITVLYYNQKYLYEYNKEVPKTWDELIDTGKFILDEEIKKNNTEFIAYNGLFSSK